MLTRGVLGDFPACLVLVVVCSTVSRSWVAGGGGAYLMDGTLGPRDRYVQDRLRRRRRRRHRSRCLPSWGLVLE